MKPIRPNAEINKPTELKNLKPYLSVSHLLIGAIIIMDILDAGIF